MPEHGLATAHSIHPNYPQDMIPRFCEEQAHVHAEEERQVTGRGGYDGGLDWVWSSVETDGGERRECTGVDGGHVCFITDLHK